MERILIISLLFLYSFCSGQQHTLLHVTNITVNDSTYIKKDAEYAKLPANAAFNIEYDSTAMFIYLKKEDITDVIHIYPVKHIKGDTIFFNYSRRDFASMGAGSPLTDTYKIYLLPASGKFEFYYKEKASHEYHLFLSGNINISKDEMDFAINEEFFQRVNLIDSK